MARTSNPDFEDGTLNAYLVGGSEVRPGDRYGYKIVLVVNQGQFKEYRAYRGPTGWSDERIEREGDAISRKAVLLELFSTVIRTLDSQGYIFGY